MFVIVGGVRVGEKNMIVARVRQYPGNVFVIVDRGPSLPKQTDFSGSTIGASNMKILYRAYNFSLYQSGETPPWS
jgi:hypothetical protein